MFSADMTETIAQLAERIGSAFDTPLLAGTRQHRIKVSIGASSYPEGGRTALVGRQGASWPDTSLGS